MATRTSRMPTSCPAQSAKTVGSSRPTRCASTVHVHDLLKIGAGSRDAEGNAIDSRLPQTVVVHPLDPAYLSVPAKLLGTLPMRVTLIPNRWSDRVVVLQTKTIGSEVRVVQQRTHVHLQKD